jgi:hypothetical protein
MDHDEVREQLELAATEPAGIDRLMAGDTPTAAAVAGHLAGCPACTEELVRLRRASIVIADALRSVPPPELRERTLAYVATYGRALAASSAASPADLPVGAPEPVAPAAGTSPGRRTRRLAWVAGMAAALVIAVLGTTVVLDARYAERLADQQAGAAGLSRVTAAAVALSAEPDVVRVDLEPTPDSPSGSVEGSLVYSAASSDLVVIASGLTEPSADREYRCWVEVDGTRTSVGRMFFGGDLAFWAGRVESVADLPEGSTFGVTLVAAGGAGLDGPAVLAGVVGR